MPIRDIDPATAQALIAQLEAKMANMRAVDPALYGQPTQPIIRNLEAQVAALREQLGDLGGFDDPPLSGAMPVRAHAAPQTTAQVSPISQVPTPALTSGRQASSLSDEILGDLPEQLDEMEGYYAATPKIALMGAAIEAAGRRDEILTALLSGTRIWRGDNLHSCAVEAFGSLADQVALSPLRDRVIDFVCHFLDGSRRFQSPADKTRITKEAYISLGQLAKAVAAGSHRERVIDILVGGLTDYNLRAYAVSALSQMPEVVAQSPRRDEIIGLLIKDQYPDFSGLYHLADAIAQSPLCDQVIQKLRALAWDNLKPEYLALIDATLGKLAAVMVQKPDLPQIIEAQLNLNWTLERLASRQKMFAAYYAHPEARPHLDAAIRQAKEQYLAAQVILGQPTDAQQGPQMIAAQKNLNDAVRKIALLSECILLGQPDEFNDLIGTLIDVYMQWVHHEGQEMPLPVVYTFEDLEVWNVLVARHPRVHEVALKAVWDLPQNMAGDFLSGIIKQKQHGLQNETFLEGIFKFVRVNLKNRFWVLKLVAPLAVKSRFAESYLNLTLSLIEAPQEADRLAALKVLGDFTETLLVDPTREALIEEICGRFHMDEPIERCLPALLALENLAPVIKSASPRVRSLVIHTLKDGLKQRNGWGTWYDHRQTGSIQRILKALVTPEQKTPTVVTRVSLEPPALLQFLTGTLSTVQDLVNDALKPGQPRQVLQHLAKSLAALSFVLKHLGATGEARRLLDVAEELFFAGADGTAEAAELVDLRNGRLEQVVTARRSQTVQTGPEDTHTTTRLRSVELALPAFVSNKELAALLAQSDTPQAFEEKANAARHPLETLYGLVYFALACGEQWTVTSTTVANDDAPTRHSQQAELSGTVGAAQVTNDWLRGQFQKIRAGLIQIQGKKREVKLAIGYSLLAALAQRRGLEADRAAFQAQLDEQMRALIAGNAAATLAPFSNGESLDSKTLALWPLTTALAEQKIAEALEAARNVVSPAERAMGLALIANHLKPASLSDDLCRRFLDGLPTLEKIASTALASLQEQISQRARMAGAAAGPLGILDIEALSALGSALIDLGQYKKGQELSQRARQLVTASSLPEQVQSRLTPLLQDEGWDENEWRPFNDEVRGILAATLKNYPHASSMLAFDLSKWDFLKQAFSGKTDWAQVEQAFDKLSAFEAAFTLARFVHVMLGGNVEGKTTAPEPAVGAEPAAKSPESTGPRPVAKTREASVTSSGKIHVIVVQNRPPVSLSFDASYTGPVLQALQIDTSEVSPYETVPVPAPTTEAERILEITRDLMRAGPYLEEFEKKSLARVVRELAGQLRTMAESLGDMITDSNFWLSVYNEACTFGIEKPGSKGSSGSGGNGASSGTTVMVTTEGGASPEPKPAINRFADLEMSHRPSSIPASTKTAPALITSSKIFMTARNQNPFTIGQTLFAGAGHVKTPLLKQTPTNLFTRAGTGLRWR